jgi:hypothetical protein
MTRENAGPITQRSISSASSAAGTPGRWSGPAVYLPLFLEELKGLF